MPSVVLQMTMRLVVEVGMEVYYNSPSMSSDDYQSDQFFRKYSGSKGKIVGFGSDYVGILDNQGRAPGVYYTTVSIDVQFDGEDEIHPGLNINHFILMSQATAGAPDTALTHQRAGDLPYAIVFYPGDIVCKADDLLCGERFVQCVEIDKRGVPVYVLAETADDRIAREAEQQAKRKDRIASGDLMLGSRFSYEKIEHCSAEQIKLVAPGNLRWLYTDPAKMQFPTPEDEVRFWAQEGLSKTVSVKNGRYPQFEYSLETTRTMVAEGQGDIIVRSKEYKHINIIGRRGDHTVRLLHACFYQYRERVRQLAQNLKVPISEV